MLDDIRNFNRNGSSNDELVELSAMGRILQSEYATVGLPAPHWLGPKLTQVRNEIAARVEAAKANRRAQIKAELRNQRSRDEVKADLERELAELGPDTTEEAKPQAAAV